MHVCVYIYNANCMTWHCMTLHDITKHVRRYTYALCHELNACRAVLCHTRPQIEASMAAPCCMLLQLLDFPQPLGDRLRPRSIRPQVRVVGLLAGLRHLGLPLRGAEATRAEHGLRTPRCKAEAVGAPSTVWRGTYVQSCLCTVPACMHACLPNHLHN